MAMGTVGAVIGSIKGLGVASVGTGAAGALVGASMGSLWELADRKENVQFSK